MNVNKRRQTDFSWCPDDIAYASDEQLAELISQYNEVGTELHAWLNEIRNRITARMKYGVAIKTAKHTEKGTN